MSIGDLATILTVAGVSIYVSGLIGLAIPIRRVFTGDISTAWYAVSLVPKTVVAGQGVRIWMRWTVAFAVPLLFVTLALRRLLPFSPLGPLRTYVIVTTATFFIIILILTVYVLILRIRQPARIGERPFFVFVLLTVGLLLIPISSTMISGHPEVLEELAIKDSSIFPPRK